MQQWYALDPVNTVLKQIRAMPANKKLSLKQLSTKLAMLLALLAWIPNSFPTILVSEMGLRSDCTVLGGGGGAPLWNLGDLLHLTDNIETIFII